jgi:hypothetical protein
MKPKIKLKPIDLSKTIIQAVKKHEKYQIGEQTIHPDIKTDNTQYLCKIGDLFYAGNFSMQWYGLNFSGCCDAGCQFDPPGVNCSRWQNVWEIIEIK